ncbi:MAG: efflux RND transporter periplasmic adaptor subunit [Planctomycetes bacterium]|nr:efflux RND transporter periplasmic adaptor subunit [Planctomycetota bacterium]
MGEQSEDKGVGLPAPESSRSNPAGASGAYRRRRRWLAAVIVAVAVLGVAALCLIRASERPRPASNVRMVNVEVMEIKPIERFADTFDLHGVVEPDRVVTVSSETKGRVKAIRCVEGSQCSLGDPLVVLDDELPASRAAQARAQIDVLAAQIKRAEAQRDMDKYDLDSVVDLRKRDAATEFALKQAKARFAGSVAALNQAKASLAGGRAALAAAEIDLARTRIAAPVSGVLNRMLVEEGEYVSAGAPLAEIVDVEQLRVVVDVPESDIMYLKPGGKAEIFPVGAGRKGETPSAIFGRIDYMSELAEQAAKTTRIEILVDNRNRALRCGKIVLVRLTRRELRDVIMIPLAAAIATEDGRAVYVVRSGRAQRREVKFGFWRGRSVQILSGLQAGDRLIVKGHRFVGPDQRVNVVPAKKSALPSWSAQVHTSGQ